MVGLQAVTKISSLSFTAFPCVCACVSCEAFFHAFFFVLVHVSVVKLASMSSCLLSLFLKSCRCSHVHIEPPFRFIFLCCMEGFYWLPCQQQWHSAQSARHKKCLKCNLTPFQTAPKCLLQRLRPIASMNDVITVLEVCRASYSSKKHLKQRTHRPQIWCLNCFNEGTSGHRCIDSCFTLSDVLSACTLSKLLSSMQLPTKSKPDGFSSTTQSDKYFEALCENSLCHAWFIDWFVQEFELYLSYRFINQGLIMVY